MAGKVLNVRDCGSLGLRNGLTGKYHAICHSLYNLLLAKFSMTTMLSQILFLTIIFLNSCGNTGRDDKNTSSGNLKQVIASANGEKVQNALTFINSYVENCNKMKQAVNVVDWVNSSTLTTEYFKSEVKRMMDEAYEKEPGTGLDADPIFDAQDYPDKGFELESLDEKTNYLTVKGKDWPEFKLTIKIIEEGGNWLIDGCGMVNIPNDQRAGR